MKKILLAVIAIVSFAFTSQAQSNQRLKNGSHVSDHEPCGFWGEASDGSWNCDGSSGTICYCMSVIIINSIPSKGDIQKIILENRFKGLDAATLEAVKLGKFSFTKIGNKDFLIKPDNSRVKGMALHF